MRGVLKEACDEVPDLEETVWSVGNMDLKYKSQQAYEKMLNLANH